MLKSISRRVRSELPAKMAVEGRKIAKSGFERDGRDWPGRHCDFNRRMPQPLPQQILIRGAADDPLKGAEEMIFAHCGSIGQLRQINAIGETLLQDPQRGADTAIVSCRYVLRTGDTA